MVAKDTSTMVKSNGETTRWEKSAGQNNQQNQARKRVGRYGQGDGLDKSVKETDTVRSQHDLKLQKPPSVDAAAAMMKVANVKQVLAIMEQEEVDSRQGSSFCGAAGIEEEMEGHTVQGWVEVWDQCSRMSMWSKRPGRRWMVAVIQKLWDVAWDLWEQRNGIRSVRMLLRVNVTFGDIADEKFSRPPFNIG